MTTGHQEAEKIQERLSSLPGVRQVTRGWPRNLAELPVIAVSKASERPAEFRDDRAYVVELEYYIRIFAVRTSQTDELAEAVDRAMEELGYTRTFSYDDDDADVRMAVMRFRKYM